MSPLEGPADLLQFVQARDVAAAVKVVRLRGSEVNCLSVARDIFIGRRRFLGHGLERRIHHARPSAAHCGG
jgi:hypothetical protein